MRSNLLGQLKSEIHKEPSEADLIQMHHDFMCCYGWISLEEFKKIPIPTIWGLANYVMKEKNKREQFRISGLV